MKIHFIIIVIFLTIGLFGQNTEYSTYSDGNRIVFTQEGSGPIAIIFVHGWCCNKEFWKFQTQYFSKKYQTIAIDMGGYGESELRSEHSLRVRG